MLKASIDESACNGCGLCETMCPEVFALNAKTAIVTVEEVPNEAEAACQDVAESCPMEAVTLEEEEDIDE